MGHLDNTYSVNEVAAYFGIEPREVYTALRKDLQTSPFDRRLPGAWQPSGMKNAEWFIPQAAVDHWRELRQQRVDDRMEDVEL